jgi:hypothetical protein
MRRAFWYFLSAQKVRINSNQKPMVKNTGIEEKDSQSP